MLKLAMLDAFDDGLAGIQTAATNIRDWSAPTPCESWQAIDLAGHLLAIARYYHGLLDAALAGSPRRDLPRGALLQAMNARDLDALGPSTGPNRIAGFLASASEYRVKIAAANWEIVLGEWSGAGPRTLGQHTGLAIVEWHVHAWDLARTTGRDHRPADPKTVAAGRVELQETRDDRDPWHALLALTGRRTYPEITL